MKMLVIYEEYSYSWGILETESRFKYIDSTDKHCSDVDNIKDILGCNCEVVALFKCPDGKELEEVDFE